MSKESVKGYEGLYWATPDGQIFGKKGKLAQFLNKQNGYLYVCLSKNKAHRNFSVHRLIALTFLKKRSKRNIVNHKNSIKIDNRVENLEWCTVGENNKHGWRYRRELMEESLRGLYPYFIYKR